MQNREGADNSCQDLGASLYAAPDYNHFKNVRLLAILMQFNAFDGENEFNSSVGMSNCNINDTVL